MRTETKVSATVIGVLVALIAVFAVYVTVQRATREEPAPAEVAQAAQVDGHVLGEPAPDGAATLVEFLDFECEACRAAYPVIEQMRDDHEGEVTFVLRYFPLPGHANSRNAAWAVEAAAQQDALEPMYKRMYDTQAEWGEQQDSKAAVFRGFAEDLGLDMDQYDRDVASQDTKDRVERDYQAGLALGVQGTPTFFLNGEPLQPTSIEEFIANVDAAAGENR